MSEPFGSLTFPPGGLPLGESADEAMARQVRRMVEGDLAVESTQLPRHVGNTPLTLCGRLLKPSHEVFPRWLAECKEAGYTPFLLRDPDGITPEHVILRVVRGAVKGSTGNPLINLVLFIATLLSTLLAGALNGPLTPEPQGFLDLLRPAILIQGWPFALTLLAILSAHEFGHYFAARYHGVRVTLPFFIPMPTIFGTLGAVIAMREPIPDQRKLFDIGVAGPLAGLIVAIPLLLIGLSSSELTTWDETQLAAGQVMLEGNSLLYYGAKFLIFGQGLPNWTTMLDVSMNRVTFAAWIGLLVTALNLLPVGQLDGGHTVFALFGKKARAINIGAMALMAGLGVAGLPQLQELFPVLQRIGFSGWFLWLGLTFFLIGPFHPPALDDVTTLDPRRRLVGYLVVLIFILAFVPVPMRFL